MGTTLKQHLREQFWENVDYYVRDLEALGHERLGQGAGGTSRSAYDFTYELVIVHRRIEARLTGKDPGAYPGAEAWIVAPDEFRNPETAIREVRESAEAVLAAFDAWPESDLEREIPIPSGKTSALDLMSLGVFHLIYHDAQLNYIQSIHGDGAMHWQD